MRIQGSLRSALVAILAILFGSTSSSFGLWRGMESYQIQILLPRGGSDKNNTASSVQYDDNYVDDNDDAGYASYFDSFTRMGQALYDSFWRVVLDANQSSFLDSIRLVAQNLLQQETDAKLLATTQGVVDQNAITPQTDLTKPGRYFTIVTTAALPWMTGTAVNPLLRAAYLVRKTKQINNNNQDSNYSSQWVTLLIPWLELQEDQEHVYHRVFENPEQQEDFIRDWLRSQADMPDAADPTTGLKIMFYPARYHSGLKSIFAMGDICSLIDNDKADVCILEEPEHLNWYRAPGTGYTNKFSYVIGVVHTNYKEYAATQYHGLWTAPALALMSSAMVRAYCHKVIKLSDVLQTFAPEKESTSNIHGVRQDFLALAPTAKATTSSSTERKAYFIGKLLWAKGFDIMLDLQEYYKDCTGHYFPIDVYGSGPDQKEIMKAFLGRKHFKDKKGEANDERNPKEELASEKVQVDVNGNVGGKRKDLASFRLLTSSNELLLKAKDKLEQIRANIRKTTSESLQEMEFPKNLYELRRQPIPSTFPGRVDHALLKDEYSVFVNPSVSEVLCTTTAEALAMGKFVIIPVHPSNTFFLKFPNCLAYRNKLEFAANLRWALNHDPEPLTPELAREFTWEAATERLIEASAVTHKEARERQQYSKLDQRIAWFHNELGKGSKGDRIRKVLGAGPASDQVKYILQKEQQSKKRRDENDDDNSKDGEDDELESNKFRGSALAEAIRNTVAKGLPTLMT